jgi:hypothetical protein
VLRFGRSLTLPEGQSVRQMVRDSVTRFGRSLTLPEGQFLPNRCCR